MQSSERVKNIISKLLGCYVIFLSIAFPLFVHDKYFDILNDKFYLFWVSCALISGIAALIGLMYALSGAGRGQGRGIKALFKELLPSNIKKYLRLPDYFFIGFMLVSIISTVCSEYPNEAFWGQYGRYQGLFLWLFYAATYVLFSRFYEAKKWHIDVFLLGGVILCLWGITDYLGFDIFGWRAAIDDAIKRYDFSSGIGNINSLTMIQALYIAVSSAMFVLEPTDTKQGRLRKLWYGIASFINFMAIIMASSDNALLSTAAVLYFLPFVSFKDRRGVTSYIELLAIFMFSMYGTGELTSYFKGLNAAAEAAGGSVYFDVLPDFKWGIMLKLANTQTELIGALLATVLFVGALYYILSFSTYRRLYGKRLDAKDYGFDAYLSEPVSIGLRIVWGLMGAAALFGIIYIFVDANSGGHPERYEAYKSFLIFNDSWGTNRGYNWRLLTGYFSDFPLFRKLIGAGPETYGVYTSIYDLFNMMDLVNETYDSPHNEVLQYLFSTGIIGCFCYYMGIITVILTGMFGKLRRVQIGLKHRSDKPNTEAEQLSAASSKTADGDKAKAAAASDASLKASSGGKAHKKAKAGASLKSEVKVTVLDGRPTATPISIACAFAVLSYTAASVIAISAPTATPMMILLLSICVGEAYRSKAKE